MGPIRRALYRFESLFHRANPVPTSEVKPREIIKCGANLNLINRKRFPEINGLHFGSCPLDGKEYDFELNGVQIHIEVPPKSFVSTDIAHTHKILAEHYNCICFRNIRQIKYRGGRYTGTFWHEYAHVLVNLTDEEIIKNFDQLGDYAHGPVWAKTITDLGYEPSRFADPRDSWLAHYEYDPGAKWNNFWTPAK